MIWGRSIVVRMPGGFGKDVGDPWHSVSDEVRFAHMYGWQFAMPSNAADAVGLLRFAMRSPNPSPAAPLIFRPRLLARHRPMLCMLQPTCL